MRSGDLSLSKGKVEAIVGQSFSLNFEKRRLLIKCGCEETGVDSIWEKLMDMGGSRAEDGGCG